MSKNWSDDASHYGQNDYMGDMNAMHVNVVESTGRIQLPPTTGRVVFHVTGTTGLDALKGWLAPLVLDITPHSMVDGVKIEKKDMNITSRIGLGLLAATTYRLNMNPSSDTQRLYWLEASLTGQRSIRGDYWRKDIDESSSRSDLSLIPSLDHTTV
uniref:Uncharacterized protein n=1 Tax=Solanum tuberosum TaxID=4113 RepID=M1DBE2_SOLTU